MQASVHVPVLADEVIHWLNPQPGETFIDGTLGGGGHARQLAERVKPDGRVIALDRDPRAVQVAKEHFAGGLVNCQHADFRDLPTVLADEG